MTAICALVEEELLVHPKANQIALPRLVGLVNGVEGSWSEERGGLGCDSRWLSKQLKSFSLPAKPVRDPIHSESAARGYEVYELLAVSKRYRAGVEGDADTPQPRPEEASTSSTSSTGSAKLLKEQDKTGGPNVDEPAVDKKATR